MTNLVRRTKFASFAAHDRTPTLIRLGAFLLAVGVILWFVVDAWFAVAMVAVGAASLALHQLRRRDLWLRS
jgi:hypothetical protein